MNAFNWALALAVTLALFVGGSIATTVTDTGTNLADVTGGGNAASHQSGASVINANGDVIVNAGQGAETKAYTGVANVRQADTQTVNGANDVLMQTINAAKQDAKKGGILVQENTQTTNNKGDTVEFASDTSAQKGGLKADYTDTQLNTQNGYGAANNEITGIIDLSSKTGKLGKVIFEQGNTKNIDPKSVVAFDEISACVESGKILGNEWNKDTIGATEFIDATEKISATTSAWDTSTVKQADTGKFFSPGNVFSTSANYNKNTAFLGDAATSQSIDTDVNTHPWGPAKRTQIVGLGSFNTDEVTSILGDAASTQTKKTNVH